MHRKVIPIVLCLLIAGATAFRLYDTAPKKLEKITSPDGKITAVISEKSGNLLVESNRTNPLTIDYENDIEYGMSAFSSDSRYLFVAVEKEGTGLVECRDFVGNKSFSIHLQNIVRTSSEFDDFADTHDITEINECIVSVLDITDESIANITFRFRDQNGKMYTPFIWVDLYNQQVAVLK